MELIVRGEYPQSGIAQMRPFHPCDGNSLEQARAPLASCRPLLAPKVVLGRIFGRYFEFKGETRFSGREIAQD
jgi:hypothetical protein